MDIRRAFYVFIYITLLSFVHPAYACTINNNGLPDPSCTFGNTLEVSKEQVCVKGYTGTVRYVPQSMKNNVYNQYYTSKDSDYCPCEVDHFIPLCLGGSNAISNLWPQTYQGQWSARWKDKLEVHLWRLVCKDKITLAEAQSAILTDWRKAYIDYGLYEKENRDNHGVINENIE